MKIALTIKPWWVLPTSPEHTWAPGMVLTQEAADLTKAGHDVRVYAAKGSQISGELIDFDMMPYKEISQGDIPPIQVSIREQYYLHEFLRRTIEHLRANPVDVLHLHDYRDYPVFAAANLGIPIVATVHGDYYENFVHAPAEVLKSLESTNLISLTKPRQLPAGMTEPIGVVPNTFDADRFNFIAKPQDRLVYVGRITDGKGADLAIKVVEAARTGLDIYGGQFPYAGFEQEFLKLVKNSPKVTYHGRLKQSEVEPAYDARAMIFPIREAEGFPLGVLEALATGTPVITFDVGGMSDIVTDGVNGFVLPAGDIEGMAAAIRKIDQVDRAACRRSVIERFNPDVITKQLLAVFAKVIKKENG